MFIEWERSHDDGCATCDCQEPETNGPPFGIGRCRCFQRVDRRAALSVDIHHPSMWERSRPSMEDHPMTRFRRAGLLLSAAALAAAAVVAAVPHAAAAAPTLKSLADAQGRDIGFA